MTWRLAPCSIWQLELLRGDHKPLGAIWYRNVLGPVGKNTTTSKNRWRNQHTSGLIWFHLDGQTGLQSGGFPGPDLEIYGCTTNFCHEGFDLARSQLCRWGWAPLVGEWTGYWSYSKTAWTVRILQEQAQDYHLESTECYNKDKLKNEHSLEVNLLDGRPKKSKSKTKTRKTKVVCPNISKFIDGKVKNHIIGIQVYNTPG